MRVRLLLAAVGLIILGVAIGVIATLVGGAAPGGTDQPTATAGSILQLPPRAGPCPPAIQAEIDAAEAGTTLDLRGCQYETGVTIDRPLTLVGVTLRVPPGQAGITVTADDVTLDGVAVIGSQFQTYDFAEMGVVAWAETGAPISRLTIRDSAIAFFGGFGTYLRNVADVRLSGNDVHDVVYAGIMVLSAEGGTIEGNEVRRIGVQGSAANEDNAYGIALTTQGNEPPTADMEVVGNTVEDVPSWHALDTHGGQRIVFRGNTVRRTPRAIFITTNSAGDEPTGIEILDNRLLSPAPVDTNLAVITLYRAHDVRIVGNTAQGWGNGVFLRDFEDQSTNVVVEDNTVER